MLLDEDFVVIARMVLLGIIGLLLIVKWLYLVVFKSNHPKESLRFRLITPYGQREVYATGSSAKRNFMTNNNRLVYLLYILLALFLMLLVIPTLA